MHKKQRARGRWGVSRKKRRLKPSYAGKDKDRFMIDIKEQKLPIDPGVKETIDLFVSRIHQKFGEKIIKVILFGSYARGDSGPESDVDLLILTSEDSFDHEYALIGMGYDLFLEKGVLISIKVVTDDQYQAKKNYLFFKEVNREGVVVA